MKLIRPGDAVAFLLFLVAFCMAGYQGYLDPVSSGLALAAVVQSTYGGNISPAVAGMWANMTNWDADTRIAEGNIGFGLACGQGTADRGAVLGGALALFVGVSVKDITLVHDTADRYETNDNMAVGNEGDIWVQTSVAVTPADPVHYSSTTGIFAISGGEGPIVGARWMESSAAGLGLLRLSGHLPVA